MKACKEAVDAKDGCAACVGRFSALTGRWYFSDWKTCWNTGMSRWGEDCRACAVHVRRKEFSFEKLGEQWQEFCQKINENGESFAAFLQTVPAVEVKSGC